MPRPLPAALLASVLASVGLAPQAAVAQDPVFSVESDPDLGRYIVGPEGQPVYMFDTQVSGGDGLPPLESCGARCRGTWSPVKIAPTASRQLGVSGPLQEQDIAVVAEDGELIATYDGHPLFHFAREHESEGPSGHGMHKHGGWWIALAPDGTPIRTGSIPSHTEY